MPFTTIYTVICPYVCTNVDKDAIFLLQISGESVTHRLKRPAYVDQSPCTKAHSRENNSKCPPSGDSDTKMSSKYIEVCSILKDRKRAM